MRAAARVALCFLLLPASGLVLPAARVAPRAGCVYAACGPAAPEPQGGLRRVLQRLRRPHTSPARPGLLKRVGGAFAVASASVLLRAPGPAVAAPVTTSGATSISRTKSSKKTTNFAGAPPPHRPAAHARARARASPPRWRQPPAAPAPLGARRLRHQERGPEAGAGRAGGLATTPPTPAAQRRGEPPPPSAWMGERRGAGWDPTPRPPPSLSPRRRRADRWRERVLHVRGVARAGGGE